MWTQASRRLPPSSRRGNLLTLWCNGEILGASECFAFVKKRIVLCSCWRTWQEQMGIPPTKNRHRDTSSADEDVNEQSTKNQHKESHAFWLFSCQELKLFIKVRCQGSVILNCTMLYKKDTQSCLIVLKIWLPLMAHLQSKRVWINTFLLSLSLCCLASRFSHNQGLMYCFTKLYFTYLEKQKFKETEREKQEHKQGV